MSKTYDAAQSRARLLEAAQTLFSEHGYEHTTTRRIAEAADIDAALIARYFGNKEGLYLAAVAADLAPAVADALHSPAVVASWLFNRTRERGPGPIMQALVRSDTAPDIRAAASLRFDRMLIDPLETALDAVGLPQPRLRAEIIAFSILGLVIGRSRPGSALDQIGHDELVQLVADSLAQITAVNSIP